MTILRMPRMRKNKLLTMIHELHHYYSEIGFGGTYAHIKNTHIFPKGRLTWLDEGITQLYTLRMGSAFKHSSQPYPNEKNAAVLLCLLYTSDAADE